MTLIDWINKHDCGVTPCAIIRDGKIVIRVLVGDENSTEVQETVVSTLKEARDARGY